MTALRIGIVSDLHADKNDGRGHDVISPLARQAEELAVDRLLVAGDLAGGAHEALDWLERLRRRAACAVDFVPGNHDVWDETNSRRAYERLAAHPACLAGSSRRLPGGWTLVGDMGWYDYAFRHPSFSLSRIRSKRFGRFRWLDAYHARWQQSDPQLTQWFAARLEKRLSRHGHRAVVLVTHMVPYRQFLLPVRSARWRFIQAYLGSPIYGELADRHQVAAVVFGHTHHYHRSRFRGKEVVCNPVGYVGREPVRQGREPVQLEVLELAAQEDAGVPGSATPEP